MRHQKSYEVLHINGKRFCFYGALAVTNFTEEECTFVDFKFILGRPPNSKPRYYGLDTQPQT
jgi:hypothetical protein